MVPWKQAHGAFLRQYVLELREAFQYLEPMATAAGVSVSCVQRWGRVLHLEIRPVPKTKRMKSVVHQTIQQRIEARKKGQLPHAQD